MFHYFQISEVSAVFRNCDNYSDGEKAFFVPHTGFGSFVVTLLACKSREDWPPSILSDDTVAKRARHDNQQCRTASKSCSNASLDFSNIRKKRIIYPPSTFVRNKNAKKYTRIRNIAIALCSNCLILCFAQTKMQWNAFISVHSILEVHVVYNRKEWSSLALSALTDPCMTCKMGQYNLYKNRYILNI